MSLEMGFDWDQQVYEELLPRVKIEILPDLIALARQYNIPYKVKLPEKFFLYCYG